jgi:PTH1 family peptidyl-tRNA hydrolase
MKLIVGLGNPGKKYEGTRHNIGFDVVQEIARKYSSERPKARFHGETLDFRAGSEKIVLLCPLTFMNCSGQSVKAAVDFYQLDPIQDLLVTCDDFNLEFGKIRMRPKGSAGGQKGLDDIIRLIGNQFCRLRVGIGGPPEGWNVPDYVLSRFRENELQDLKNCIQRASDAAICWASEGVQEAMNRYNVWGDRQAESPKKSKLSEDTKATDNQNQTEE